MSKKMYLQIAVVALAAILIASMAGVQQGQVAPQAVAIDPDDIGGVVSGARGPEAGVWVIAETRDTPTRLIKTVVTDDRGRYLIPDLPKGTYDVWVRGYGLIDSPKVKALPGKSVNLTAVAAPGPGAAAAYYPAQYWFALLQLPPKSDFPGTGASGNGISESMRSQGEWIRNVVSTDGCTTCHQLGNRATREMPEALGTFANSVLAWDRRIQSGQAGGSMSSTFTRVGRQRALQMYADWTDRIAKGELPSATPPRPQGKERNVVITMWDWADPKAYLHDEIASDKRNPRVNANGPIYGALEASADYLPVVDPVHNTASQVKLTVRDPKTPNEGSTKPRSRRHIGTTKQYGKVRLTPTASRWTVRGASGSPPACDRIRLWRSAGKVQIIRPRRPFRSLRADVRSNSTIPKPNRSRPWIPVSARII